jgi:copper resistance protein B
MKQLYLLILAIVATAPLSTTNTQAQTEHELQSTVEKEARTPLWSQADQYYDAEEMAAARKEVLHEGGAQKTYYILFNQLEAQSANSSDDLYWNGQAWYGGDINKLWLKTEGRSPLNSRDVEDAELQALYSRAIAPYWDIQAGIRHDFEPDSLDHAVVALHGLAPYFFEVDVSAFLSTDGDLTVRAELEYELLLTQKLILQPRIEANLSAQDIPERGLGDGLSNIDAGIRLRYEFLRELSTYIGVEWQHEFGDTKHIVEAAGGDAEQTVLVAGIRAWF